MKYNLSGTNIYYNWLIVPSWAVESLKNTGIQGLWYYDSNLELKEIR